jgi:D-3-phosphoglycerate dehydrogenase
VAELTIGLMLNLLRHISFVDRELRKGNWLKETGNLLRGKKVGIIGLGRIGKKVAELLRPFDVRVSGADLQPDYAWFKANDVLPVTLDDLIADADIISLHLSHLGGNKHLLGEKEFNAMKKGAFILNLSRGDVINEAALFGALSSGKIAGAALDVFSKEPYDGPLKKLDSVILTPHIGSYAREARIEMETQAVANLLKALGHNIK